MDVRGNKVKLDDDTEISYDKCLIATGKTLLKGLFSANVALIWWKLTEAAVSRWSAKKSAGCGKSRRGGDTEDDFVPQGQCLAISVSKVPND